MTSLAVSILATILLIEITGIQSANGRIHTHTHSVDTVYEVYLKQLVSDILLFSFSVTSLQHDQAVPCTGAVRQRSGVLLC